MKLGAFSISLAVKNLQVSREFYENVGFKVFAGSPEQNYYIMKNGDALIGIFHGMFEGNIITLNPGWDQNAQLVPDYDDVRQIQEQLKSKGISFIAEADTKTEGPANFIIQDPDGNTILFDQHV